MKTLVANGLADSDIKGGPDNTEFMYTSINIYIHIINNDIVYCSR